MHKPPAGEAACLYKWLQVSFRVSSKKAEVSGGIVDVCLRVDSGVMDRQLTGQQLDAA